MPYNDNRKKTYRTSVDPSAAYSPAIEHPVEESPVGILVCLLLGNVDQIFLASF